MLVAADMFHFLNWAISLLEEIESSHEKKSWCKGYSIYTRNTGQEELEHNLDLFMQRSYDAGCYYKLPSSGRPVPS